MQADQLYVVTAVSNPLLTLTRPTLTRAFVPHMVASGVHLILVEATLGDRPHELADLAGPCVTHVPVRHSTILWHKESLLNVGLSRLPAAAEYVAWIDADLTFRLPGWAADTLDALQQFSVVQPWEHCYDLGPSGMHLQLHTSLASLHRKRKPVLASCKPGYEPAHPGYAWAARRETLDKVGGLYDLGILGAADRMMAMSILGRVGETFYADITPQFMESMRAWQALALRVVNDRMGYVPGTIEHSFHGPKAKRGYVTRPEILRKHAFDPVTDVRYNLDGVLELAGNKRDLQHAIELYFSSRDEDSNSPV